MRSTAGLAAVIHEGDGTGLPGLLGHPLARTGAQLAVGAELVVDKMPFAGSRLEAPGLAGRLLFAGAAAALIARRDESPIMPALVVALAAAALVAKVAHDVRALVATKVPDQLVAVVEDGLALGTARLGARW